MKKTVGILSVLLALTIAVNAVTPAMSVTIQKLFSPEPQVASVYDSFSNDYVSEEDYSVANGSKSTASSAQKEAAYEDGKILIYNFEQLSMIGSGKSYKYDDGVTATYSSDAEYKLARDISLPRHTVWQPPDGFKGKITGEKQSYAPLYEAQRDAIYLYNPYQLAVMAMDNREEQPVMDGDAEASTFGSGKVVCTDKENKNILTYSDDRNYVISAQFSSEVTEKPISVNSKKSAEAVGAKADNSVGAKADSSVGAASDGSGRDFKGQVVKTIGNKKYILIGNQEQLRKIGTGDRVYPAVYLISSSEQSSNASPVPIGDHSMVYGGDADLLRDQNGTDDYPIQGIHSKPTGSTDYYASVDQETGLLYCDAAHTSHTLISTEITDLATKEKYTSDANYIIFRNIDLEGTANSNHWTPLMFSGEMYGAKLSSSSQTGLLWDSNGLVDTNDTPVISNVYIKQDSTLNVSEYIGVGFFATISNKVNTTEIGLSGGTAIVKNIDLHDVHVENNTSSSTSDHDNSLINLVTTGVGTITGGLLRFLLSVLSLGEISLDGTDALSRTLNKLLNARAADPTIYSTGAFAGRMYGDVLVEDCRVSGTVEVSNVNDRTGGFVGYTEGMTEYDGLSELLGGAKTLLSNVLNVIPAIGLGDLVTILLGNVLQLDQLVPTGYKAPLIHHCEANGLTGTIGHADSQTNAADTDYVGGFVGQQIGTRITGCSVTNGTFTVRAENFGGGFCGLARDAVIKGTLDNLGVDISQATLQSMQDMHPQSVLMDCTIMDWSGYSQGGAAPNITGGSLLGGFVGAMTESYAIDCTIDYTQEVGAQPIKVTGTGDSIGGFAGCATVGWQSSLGEPDNNGLLGTVGSLVTTLVSQFPDRAQMLLSLTGVSPSAVLGCQIYSSGLEVTAASDYAGGLIGKGDAVYLGKSDQAAYTVLAGWDSGTLKTTPLNRPVILNALKSVSAHSYAGGVAGYMGSAAFQGLLNDVVGLGDFIGFTARDITVTGATGGYTVTASDHDAGGGFGCAVGGEIESVNLYELKQAQAYNRAAGFVAVAGPGELAGTGGLTVNLLGLNNVLHLSNLLNVGQGVKVHITSCSVTGIGSGFDVNTTGTNSGDASVDFIAGGFIADSNSTKISDSHVYSLNSVTSDATYGYAGGFIGMSSTGGLAEVAESGNASIGTDTLTDGYYLIKPDWTINALAGKFSPNPNSEGGYMLSTTLVEGDKIKVVKVENGAITAWYPRGTGNEYTVNAAHAGDVTIYFKDSYQIAWSTFGGYINIKASGNNLHGLDQFVDKDKAVLNVNGLVTAISYLIPSYTNCTTAFVTGDLANTAYVSANVAGGFVADLESGTVDNAQDPKWTKTVNRVYDPDTNYPATEDKQFAVFNLREVRGQAYGGGFGGKLRSGALANAGRGISILGDLKVGDTQLNINLNDLARVINTYVPYVKHAGVYSADGFTVTANTIRSGDSLSGSAGGFAGYMSGAQVSSSDVYQLKRTNVSPPADLEAVDAPSYYTNASSYAVTGGHFAGGYVGSMDIGDAASIGHSLGILGSALSLENIAKALSVVVSTIEHSDVQGAPGGFSAIADGIETVPSGSDSTGKVGKAGGYAGENAGGHIQNSHCKNFYYIIGEEAAGGYVGSLKPGDVAKLLDNASVIKNLISVSGSLLSLVEDFVPTIRNSTTSCVPCGGAVRADARSDSGKQRGCAGGYCGHNEGGHIWGLDDHTWQRQNDGAVGSMNFGHVTEGKYTGEKHIANAWRIRSVYGVEYAGGYTGFMEAADTANTGNISLLGGLVNATNLLSALSVVYPTETNTAVYGPLKNLDAATWDLWVKNIAKYGGYGLEIVQALNNEPNTTFSEDAKYYYGCNVVAGRSTVFDTAGNNTELYPITEGGDAGGYVGLMRSGVITNGQSYDMKLVRAMRGAGGYAGSMQTGGLADAGDANVSLLGLDIKANLGKLVSAVGDAFVPAVQTGSVSGWESGLTVIASGVPTNTSQNHYDVIYRCGYAGGYVGAAYGAQLFGDKNVGNTAGAGCNVDNLRYVRGTNAAGGYAGIAMAASMAEVGTHAAEEHSLVQEILDIAVENNKSELVNLLQATVTHITNATVNADDAAFGFIVEGAGDEPPLYAGGFAGKLEASIVGRENFTASGSRASDIVVNGLRSADGKYYAGGFFGLADVTGVAEVSGDSQSGGTDVLGLIGTEEVSVLDTFRPYVYYSEVNGVSDGFIVRVHDEQERGTQSERTYSGCAGGFGGAMMNGVVDHSKVTNLNTAEGLNYVGGFIGHMGRSGVVDADQVNALSNLIELTAGVIDVFSTHTDNCSVTGITNGAVITAKKGQEPIAGGFAGYADVSKINNCHVANLKQVNSGEIAGGFVGKTDMHYLVNVEANSPVVNALLNVVNVLVKALYLDEAEQINLINADIANIIGVQVLSTGNLIKVNLLGLVISVSLSKAEEGSDQTDVAIITIGDSVIALPCSENGLTGNSSDNSNVVINLIKGNRTHIEGCTVTGIADGYDVYGGGASNTEDGSDVNGMTGGFVGYNYEGKLVDNEMIYCDTVRGTAKLTGPFSGNTYLQSVYSFNSIPAIEGDRNVYHVYRQTDMTRALTGSDNQLIATGETNGTYEVFTVTHLASPLTLNEGETYDKIYGKWNGAKLAPAGSTDNASLIKVYVSSAKAVLMSDTPTDANDKSLVPNLGEKKDPCIKTIDLTVQKIWDDENNKNGSRPDSIKVRLMQQAYNASGTAQPEPQVYKVSGVSDNNGWIEITAADHERADSSTWTRVIEDLPAVVENAGVYTYYTYTVEEAPVLGYDSTVTNNETASTPTATITNTPKEFVIEFKYYDRYRDNNTFAGIQDTPTTYSMTVNGIPQNLIDEGTVNYADLIGDKAVEFSNNALAVNNVMCDYDLWTSQDAAVQALSGSGYFYFDKGSQCPYSEEIPADQSEENPLDYHTDYLGKLNNHDDYVCKDDSRCEKWVTYFDSENTEISEENAKGSQNADVSKIVVWCYNYPKQYDVDIYGAGSFSDLVRKTVDGKAIYVAKDRENQNVLVNQKFYYNQRFGDATGDAHQNNMTGMDDGGFIENYGLPTYTGVKPSSCIQKESFENDGVTYSFAYWSYNPEGTQIASVEKDFWYRVTTDTKLYAVYAPEGSDPGISISADTNDTYVDASGTSRTRLNILGSVFGAPAYDTKVQKLSFTYIALSTQIRDNPAVYTPKAINALFEQYKDQLAAIIADYDAKNSSKPFSVANTYEGDVVNADPVEVDSELHLTLTTKGFIYTVTSNGNTAASGDATILLTNKNRAHFTATYKTSALNVNGTGSSGDTCMMYCGALKYDNGNKVEWKISTNCLIYFNGEVVSNTADNWD